MSLNLGLSMGRVLREDGHCFECIVVSSAVLPELALFTIFADNITFL